MLKIKNLSYVYGQGTPFEKMALKDINLDIKKGEFIGLIGHTGSGKSTLIRFLNGLERPQTGEVFVDGKNIWKDSSNIRNVRFQVGLVFQYPEHQLFEETVYGDIAFGPQNMGLDQSAIEERVYNAMDFVGLGRETAQKSPFELSGGQKRRVAIAGVIAMEPEVLILDEPTAGLDPVGRDDILSKIKAYHRQKNSTVILVSHSMEEIARTVDRIIVMNRGRLEMTGRPDEIFKDPKRLMEMGLDVPQITRVFNLLKEKGIPISDGVYTVKFARDLILNLLEQRGGRKC